MNCFYHPETAAVGICKSCGRGLCPECAAEEPNAIACRGRCEERANHINRIVDNNPAVLEAGNVQLRQYAWALIAVGVGSLALGLLSWMAWGDSGSAVVFCLVAAVFLAIGVYRIGKKSGYYPTTR